MDVPIESQVKDVLTSTKNTISYCFDHKREIQLFLSDNGDIRFYNMIFNASFEEFQKRFNDMNSKELKLTEKERMLLVINVQVFIHNMIGLVRVLLKYNDRLSPYDVRENMGDFLSKTPLDKLTFFIEENK